MKLKQYITEGYESISDPFELHNRITKDCKYYLRLIKGEDPFYRGMDTSIWGGIKDVRQDRRAKGMETDIAKDFNKWLISNGHVPRDKSVMATGDKKHVDNFGQSFMIFPIGSFSYTWIKSVDANFPDENTGWSNEFLQKKFKEGYIDYSKIWDIDPVVNKKAQPFENYFTTNKQFKVAIKNGYEIWMQCKSYYFAHTDHYIWDSRDNHLWFTK